MHIDHPVRGDAEFFKHLIRADAFVFHGVEHFHAITHQLHQVFVGGDDGYVAASIARAARQGGDDVVGLKPFGFNASDIEGARRVAGQRELRAQVFRQVWAVGLVGGVDVIAKGFRRMIKDHSHMRRRIAGFVALKVAEQNVAEACNRPNRQAIGFAG